MEAKILSWSNDDQWVVAYTIVTNPELRVTDKDGVALTASELSEWLDAQPAQVTRKGRIKASDDIEGWLEAYSKRTFTYVRIVLSK